LLSWLILPLVWLLGPGGVVRRQRRCQKVLGWGFQLFHWYMKVVGLIDFTTQRVDLTRFEEAEKEFGSFVVVANHPSLVDTTSIAASYPYLCCIARRAYFYNPLLAGMFRCCGAMTVGQKDEEAGQRVIEQMVARLHRGQSIIVFPEGTRSLPHELESFHRGAFEAAVRAGRPVIPVIIHQYPPAVCRGEPWWEPPEIGCRQDLEILAPLPAPAPNSKPRISAQFCSDVEAIFRDRLRVPQRAAIQYKSVPSSAS